MFFFLNHNRLINCVNQVTATLACYVTLVIAEYHLLGNRLQSPCNVLVRKDRAYICYSVFNRIS